MAQNAYNPDDRAEYGFNGGSGGGYGVGGDNGFGGGRPDGYGGGRDDTVRFNASKDDPVQRDLGAGDDVVRVSANAPGPVRLTFTSAEVGNGNAYDSNTMANQDGGLAVRLQLENGSDTPTGPVSRFDDEGITFEAARNGLTFDVRDLVSGAARGDRFEVVRLGTQGDDTLGVRNPSRPYYINAGMGNDIVTGGNADDFLVGGAGNDTLAGRRGNDTLLGGGGGDTAILNVSRDGADTVDLGAGDDVVRVSANAPGQVRLTFTSAEVGNGSPNDAGTMANQDGGLAVRLQAEDGSDGLTGPVSRFDDEGITFVSSRSGLTFDVRDLVSGVQRGDQFEVVRLGTQGDDTLTAVEESRPYYINAGMGNDTVSGGRANDFLVGGAGNDTLAGRGGNDSLIGGGGQDTFVFDAALDAAANLDSILDFTPADDTIQLSGAVFAGLPEGSLAVGAFARSDDPATADHRVIYDQGTGRVSFDADGGSRDNAVAFVTLNSKPADLSAADFIVT